MTNKLTGAEEVAWDLSELYRGVDPAIDADLEAGRASAEAFRERYHGKVASLDAAGLAAAVADLESIQSAVWRVSAYAQMHFTIDTADAKRGALLQKVRELSARVETLLLFFSLEWIAIEESVAESMLSDVALETYRHHLESARRYRPHVLSEPEEKVITEWQVTGRSAWSRLFEELTSALRPEIDGEQVSMEQAQAVLQRPDRDERRNAAEAITVALRDGLRTRAFIYNTLIAEKATEDRLRNYSHWLASRNLSNEISDEASNALVEAVVGRYDIPQRYYALKARLLGLDRIADYDRLAPVSADSTFVEWGDARLLVTQAYQEFSPTAGEIVSGFFEKSWIDAPPRPNKSSGAYCMMTLPGVHPYVMTNYTGERRSVLTLAHELGHGLHGVLAGRHGLFNAQTTLTMAETASVFGEALVFGKLLAAEDDPRRKLDLLIAHLDVAMGTVFRQIAFNRFEDAAHTARRSEGELSADRLSDAWFETQSTVLGPACEITDGYRIWWSYIPHFIRTPGYVYAYAFGYLFSLAIYRRYLEQGPSMVDAYLELLTAGGSDAPERLAKIVGIDLGDAGFWAGGLDGVAEVLEEAEAIAASI